MKLQHSLAIAAAVASTLWVANVHAAQTSFEYNHAFTGTAPAGTAPWLHALFDDNGVAGRVTLTLSSAGLSGAETVNGMYFNLDPTLNPNSLSFYYNAAASTGPAASSIAIGVNKYRADGDGYYDIFFNFPPPGKVRFSDNETVVYSITGIPSLTAESFRYLSKPGPSNNPGPFFSAAHVQNIGTTNNSGWIAPVPEASNWAMFGAGLLLLGIGRVRRWI